MEPDRSHPGQTTGCAVILNAAIVFILLAIVIFVLQVLWSRFG